MTKQQMKEMITDAICPHKICRLYFKYDINYWYGFPLKISDKLFLCANEDDFIIDGYSIRRFRDLNKVEIKDDKCLEILTHEGLVDRIKIPDVDIGDWYSIFTSLQKIGKNIIIEKESLDYDKCEFAIGKIIKVYKNKLYLKDFDADGIWQEDLWEIPYSQITSVTFNSRYVDVFSKYLDPIELI